MKRICIMLSLKEKKAITEQARHLHLCRCTFIYKALQKYKRHIRYTTQTKTRYRRNLHVR